MTIIKNLIEYSDEFIETYERWYDENYQDNTLLWDYINLFEFFRVESNNKIHFLVCHQHVTIEELKSCTVKYFTGEDAYKEALKYLYDLHKNDYIINKVQSIYHEYDIYPYYSY